MATVIPPFLLGGEEPWDVTARHAVSKGAGTKHLAISCLRMALSEVLHVVLLPHQVREI
jgi:hypothetical protein